MWAGEKLDKSKLDKMSGEFWCCLWCIWMDAHVCRLDQQIGQLYELMKAIKDKDDGREE